MFDYRLYALYVLLLGGSFSLYGAGNEENDIAAAMLALQNQKPGKAFLCPGLCKNYIASQAVCQEHLEGHHQIVAFEEENGLDEMVWRHYCTICGKHVAKKADIAQHQTQTCFFDTDEAQAVYRCFCCNEVMLSRQAVKEHRQGHHSLVLSEGRQGQLVNICIVCDKTVDSLSDVFMHGNGRCQKMVKHRVRSASTSGNVYSVKRRSSLGQCCESASDLLQQDCDDVFNEEE